VDEQLKTTNIIAEQQSESDMAISAEVEIIDESANESHYDADSSGRVMKRTPTTSSVPYESNLLNNSEDIMQVFEENSNSMISMGETNSPSSSAQ
jgi:hypothetical protein